MNNNILGSFDGTEDNKNSTFDINDDAGLEDVSSSLISSNVSSSFEASSYEVTNSAKKEINYIFQLNVTKKKLETIQKRIDKLLNKAQAVATILQEKYSLLPFHQKQLYFAEIEYQKQLSIFHHNMKICRISDVKIFVDAQAREKFLHAHQNSYLKNVVLPTIKASGETDSSKIQYLKTTLLDQEIQRITQILDQLHVAYISLVVEQESLNERKRQLEMLKKEILNLQSTYASIQSAIAVEQKKYDEVYMHGFLKAYEVSGNKISINDFVATPIIETQMKKLISIFNNAHEAKKIGLSLPKGILFFGKPETGKTFAAKVLASEINRKMYHIKAHDLFSETSTDPNQMIYIIFRSIIDHVQKTKEPCIIFLDEIEKIIDSMGEYNPTEQKIIANTILKNIINIQKSNLDIIIIAALVQKNKIDPRFLKYDIFDNQFFFELPGKEERKRLFQLYISKAEKRAKLKLFDPAVIDVLVDKTEGFSAEYIKQLITICVKEYLYRYLTKKTSFDIDKKTIIETARMFINNKNSQFSSDNILSREYRQKIVTKFMQKYLIFGALDDKTTLDDIKNTFLDVTEQYSEEDIHTFLNMLLDVYQRRKSEYHRQSLINIDFILEKIDELKREDRLKGNSSYFTKE